MYRYFCKNLHDYLKINISNSSAEPMRLMIARSLLPLTDPQLYELCRKEANERYFQVGHLIHALKDYSEKYPKINKLIWEFWGYGFDAIKQEKTDHDQIEWMDEKAKLIDLLCSTHYFLS